MAKSNVHPDHYKTAGRDRPGQGFSQESARRTLAEEQARLWRNRRQNLRTGAVRSSARRER